MRRKQRITLASRRGWNRLVDFYFRNRIREVVVVEPPLWRHPWSCDLQWDEEGGTWTVGIEPGWCESPTGEPGPVVSTLARLAPQAEEAQGVEDRNQVIRARLAEGPRMRIAQGLWRPEGTDAVYLEGSTVAVLPDEIASLGVLPPTQLRETGSGLVRRIDGVVADRAQARLARAVELYLEHGRETVALRPITGGAEVVFETTFRAAPVPDPRMALRRAPIDPLDPLPRWQGDESGIVADEGIDRLWIATLWLVSPRGEPEGATPDGRWMWWVEQRVERNVAYEVTGPDLRAVPPLRLGIVGRELGLGAGRALIDLFAGDLQNRADELDARLAGTRTKGDFVAF